MSQAQNYDCLLESVSQEEFVRPCLPLGCGPYDDDGDDDDDESYCPPDL